jgi:hypothetical protein
MIANIWNVGKLQHDVSMKAELDLECGFHEFPLRRFECNEV